MKKYRQDAENLYLTAVKRWKKHLLIYVLLFIVCLIATYLFALDIFGFMNFFYIFMGGLATFFSGIAVRRPIAIYVWKSNPISFVCAVQSNALTEWDFILSCRKKTIINLIVGGIGMFPNLYNIRTNCL